MQQEGMTSNVRKAWAHYQFEKDETGHFNRIDDVYEWWFGGEQDARLTLTYALNCMAWLSEKVQEENPNFGVFFEWFHDAPNAIRPGRKGACGAFDYGEPEEESTQICAFAWGNHKQTGDPYDAENVDTALEGALRTIDAIADEHSEILEDP